jgi:hypothetical protein
MHQKDMKIQIFAPDATVDPHIYVVEGHHNSIITIKLPCKQCVGTGCGTCNMTGVIGRHKIHQTRVAKAYNKYDEIIFESAQCNKHSCVDDTNGSVMKLSDLKHQGELWSKKVKFDHGDIKAEAHVLISNDKKQFQVFNTYNGMFGRRGKAGKIYELSDSKSYDRKIAQLQKQGYKKLHNL